MIGSPILGRGVSLAVQGDSSHRIPSQRSARKMDMMYWSPAARAQLDSCMLDLSRVLQEELAWELAAPLVLLADDTNPGGTDAAGAAEMGIAAALKVADAELPPES